MNLADRPDIDTDALERLLEDLQQGDVVDVSRLVTLWSPDVPTYPSEVEDVTATEPVQPMDVLLPSGRCVVISQDCDLGRSPEVEPFVQLAPLRSVSAEEHRRARPGLSSRMFAFPDLGDGDELTNVVLDVRSVQSLEKLALMSPHVVRQRCPLDEPSRHDLREWLGRRFGRTPFPDDIQRQVVDRLTGVLRRVAVKPPSDRTMQCMAFVGVQWTPGLRPCRILVLLDPWRRGVHKVGEDEVRGFARALERGVAGVTRSGAYDVSVIVHDATEVRASDLWRFHELVPELV